jgi:hypothetical protein
MLNFVLERFLSKKPKSGAQQVQQKILTPPTHRSSKKLLADFFAE